MSIALRWIFLRLVSCLPILALVGCLGPDRQGNRCVSADKLEICRCPDGASSCSCTTRTCVQGACVTLPVGPSTLPDAACATSSQPFPSCDPAQATQLLCDGDRLYQCRWGYRMLDVPACSGVCVSVPGNAICAVSSDPWPGCDPTQPTEVRCEGQSATYQCRYGYRLADVPRPECFGSRSLCVSSAHDAACVPADAVASPACPSSGHDVRACIGNTEISCSAGYIIRNRKCASCDERECRGWVSYPCTVETDCAAGLVCHQGTTRTCSAPCTVSTECVAADADLSLPHSEIYGSCANGWCGH